MLKLFESNEKLKEHIQILNQKLFLEEVKNQDLLNRIQKYNFS